MRQHMFKIFLALFLCVLASAAEAAEEPSERILAVTACRAGEETFLYLEADGEAIPFSALDGFGLPFVDENGRTQVPLRKFAEALGASVDWDGSARRVVLAAGGDAISLTVGERILTQNGTQVEMDTAAVIVENRTYIPLRAAAEAFGYQVEYREREAVLADCRLDRPDIASAEVVAYVVGASVPSVPLDGDQLDRLCELFNQACMAGEPEELDLTDSVHTFSCEAGVELRNGSHVALRCRGRGEIAVYGVGDGFRTNAPQLYGFIHALAYGE